MGRLEEVRDFQNFVNKFRKKIPSHYNQIELVDNLLNKDLDFYISISNRSDGKTFNYISFFMKLAIEFDIKFTLVARHYTLRKAYADLIEKITIEIDHFNSKKLSFHRRDDYMSVVYGDKDIGILTDLNNATDLKYHSNVMKDFPIIIYDEFLALESDYLPDEWDKLKTIYESIDRNHGNIPYLSIPKIVLLGNAVNFDSPILANLNIYERIEKHKINTINRYGNILLEKRRNDFSNDNRNQRAFNTENDAMSTGEFNFNTYNLANDGYRDMISKNSDFFYIKTSSAYLKIMYNVENFKTNIKVVPYCEEYDFCTDVKDVTKKAIYLKDTFYKETHHKKYYRPSNLCFDNAYSKKYITDDPLLIMLNINKVIKQHLTQEQLKKGSEFSRHEKVFEDNYIERTKKHLIKQFY